MTDIPQELVDELGGQLRDDRKYTAHDHVLAKINASPDGATVNDIVTYLYYAQGQTVTKRGYIYHVLSRLRKQGFIRTENMSVPGEARNFATQLGHDHARPVVVEAPYESD